MKSKEYVRLITTTAALIALLIVVQYATAPLGNTLITGSLVNMLLVVAVMTSGLTSGLSVAFISPVMAKLVGIGPSWGIIPFIMIGNAVLVFIWHIIGNRDMGKKYISYVIALVSSAVAKFSVLYLGIVQVAIPLFLNLPEKQAAAISNTFSIPQLFTALIGGVLAVIILPPIKKAIKKQ